MRPLNLEQCSGLEPLVSAAQELSCAKSMEQVLEVVRTAARSLTGAEGATFVLREGNMCYYAAEDAISPLWQGSKFPIHTCISGWSMVNQEPAIVPDIYEDQRIPLEAYKKTFVKSLVVVPIRTENPMGAIGSYWANRHHPTSREVERLQSLADLTAVSIENIKTYESLQHELERRKRAEQLVEQFVSKTSHELRENLRSIMIYSEFVLRNEEELHEKSVEQVRTIRDAADRMTDHIDGLMALSGRTGEGKGEVVVSLNECVSDAIRKVQAFLPDERLKLHQDPLPDAIGNEQELSVFFQMLLTIGFVPYDQDEQHVRITAEKRGSMVDIVLTGSIPEVLLAPKEHLFDSFATVEKDQEEEGKEGEDGIGIKQLHQFIDRIGGRFQFNRKAGEEIRSVVSLPAAGEGAG